MRLLLLTGAIFFASALIGGFGYKYPKVEKHYLIFATFPVGVFLLYWASLDGAEFAFTIFAVILVVGLYMVSVCGFGTGKVIAALIRSFRDIRSK